MTVGQREKPTKTFLVSIELLSKLAIDNEQCSNPSISICSASLFLSCQNQTFLEGTPKYLFVLGRNNKSQLRRVNDESEPSSQVRKLLMLLVGPSFVTPFLSLLVLNARNQTFLLEES
jgi:hypothetical protein